jgi:hypothetical protein
MFHESGGCGILRHNLRRFGDGHLFSSVRFQAFALADIEDVIQAKQIFFLRLALIPRLQSSSVSRRRRDTTSRPCEHVAAKLDGLTEREPMGRFIASWPCSKKTLMPRYGFLLMRFRGKPVLTVHGFCHGTVPCSSKDGDPFGDALIRWILHVISPVVIGLKKNPVNPL